MAKIEVYSKEWCPYCTKAKALLRSKQLDYEEIDITSDAEGDVTDSHDKQIVIAAGAGANAALGVFEYLVTQH